MSVDNPYYFFNEKSPKTPDASSNSKSFSIFKRRNSKGNSPKVAIPQKSRSINSATLGSDASILGSPRGSVGSLGSYAGAAFIQQAFEMNPSNNFNAILRRPGNVEMCRERLGSYNESCAYSVGNDDVFVVSPSHHHTLPSASSSNGIRRHSFGNFANRDRKKQQQQHNQQQIATSFVDEVPTTMAPKPPVMSPTRLKSYTHRKDNCSASSNMDDILIITAKHSERAILRANFLKNRFDKITQQRGRKPFNFLHVKIDDAPFSEDIVQKCRNTALQIVILCPAFLAISHSFLMTQLKSILNIDKVLGILLDVKEETVLDIHKSALPSFRKWRRSVMKDNDQSLIGNILGIATDILGRALCQRPPCQDTNGLLLKSFSCSDGFTVIPRKVKIGQNKIVALLNEPLTKEDIVKISIEKSGDRIDVHNFKQKNPYTLQFIIPESCMEISTMIEIYIEKNDLNLGSRPVKCESRLREIEQLLRTQDSPMDFMCHSLGIGSTDRDSLDAHLLQSLQKNMPPNFHLLSGPFEKQHHFMSMREASLEEYPTLLHFAAKWGFERLCMQLMECPGGDAACEIRNCANKTPSELAEHEGYHKLANSIKSFAQIHEFTTMYHYFKGISDSSSASKVVIETKSPIQSPTVLKSPNLNKFTKQKSQENNECVQTEYMEMSSGSERESTPSHGTLAVSNLNYISVETDDENLDNANRAIHETDIKMNELNISEPPYYQSNSHNKLNNKPNNNNNKYSQIEADKFSQECSNLLENCNPSMDYLTHPSNIPVVIETESDYLFQPSNRPVELSQLDIQKLHIAEDFQSNIGKSKASQSISKSGTLKRTGSDASSTKGNADDELAEIMYDFKNNVLTIREVEQLVDKWKNRNDVKQSFREKQEQIQKLREEYDRLQEQMKIKLKRGTPFDRIKKLFSRSKTTTDQDRNKNPAEDGDDGKPSFMSNFETNQRPISTLSLHSVSSSSSGRMSTGSACSGTSLGDSGTHSDHEDRRQISFNGICRLGSPGSLIMDNYLVPPTPRPVLTPSSTPGEEKDRPIFPPISNNYNQIHTPTSPSGEHYIIFPSNLPVFPGNENQQHHSAPSLHNNGHLNTIVEVKEYTSYEPKNLTTSAASVTVQPIKVQTFNGIERNSNIIYGKLKRTPPKNFCTSFKPLPQAQQQHPSGQIKNETSEIYQNISSSFNQSDLKNDSIGSNDSGLARQSQSSSDNNVNNSFDSSCQENHNYINI